MLMTKECVGVQNAAVRLVVGAGRHDRVSEHLKNLHWLPVEQRVEFKTALMTFRCLYDIAPVYLSDLVEWYKPTLTQVIFFSKLVHLITEFNMPLCQVNTSLLNNHNFQEFFLPSLSFLREEPVAGPFSSFSYGTNHVPSIGVKNNRSKTKTCLIETKN